MTMSSGVINVNQSTGKLDSVQLLRGLAIAAVVAIHTCPDNNLLGVFARPFINFAVAMFVFLSGYLTKLDIPDTKRFMMKRAKRVLVPYVIWSIICAIPTKFNGFFVNLLTGRCSGPYYYVLVYLQLVLLTPLIVKLIRSKYRVLGWAITPISLLLCRYVFVRFGFDFLDANFKYLFVAWFVFYYMGLLLGNDAIAVKGSNKCWWALYAGTLVLSMGEGFLWYQVGNDDMPTTQLRITSIVASAVAMVLAYRFIKRYTGSGNPLVVKTLVLIGNASFGIYLSHMLIKSVLSIVPVWAAIPFPINTVILLGVSTVCVVLGKKVLSKFAWVLGL